MISRKKLLSTFISVLPITGFAQRAIPLKDLLQHIDAASPSIKTDAANVHISELQGDALRYNWLPSLKLSYQADAGTNNNLPGGYFSYGIVPGNSKVASQGSSNTILTDLGIAAFDWEVYNFGAYGAQRDLAASDVTVARSRLSLSKYQLESYAAAQYLQLCRIQYLLKIQQQLLDQTEEVSRSIRSLVKSGIRAGVDSSIAAAELSRARLNILELKNQQRLLQLQLAAFSGLDTTQIVADTSYFSSLIKTNAQAGQPDTGTHPLISLYKQAYENSLQRERLVRKSYNPKIMLDAAAWGRGSSLTAAGEQQALSQGLGLERNNYLVGLGITYNLFDLKKKQLQLRIQKANTDYVGQQLQEQQTMLGLSLSSDYAALATARQRLEEIPNELEAAQAAYRQKRSLYRSGLTDILELDAALNVLDRAETDAVEAKYQYALTLFRHAAAANHLGDLLNAL